MSTLDDLTRQMVLDIGTQAFQLEDRRLRLFLNWLMDHSRTMKVSIGTLPDTGIRGANMQKRFQSALKIWLDDLPPMGLLWEHRTITAEIEWWRNIDPIRLMVIEKTEMES